MFANTSIVDIGSVWIRSSLSIDVDAGGAGAAVELIRPLVARIESDPGREYLANWEGWARHELGAALCATGQPGEGAVQLTQALALRERWGVNGSAWTAQSRAALTRCRAA